MGQIYESVIPNIIQYQINSENVNFESEHNCVVTDSNRKYC